MDIRRSAPSDHDLITALVLLALHGVVDLADKLFEDVLQEEDPDESSLRVAHVPEVGPRAACMAASASSTSSS